MEVTPKMSGHYMPKALDVKPNGPPPQSPYTQLVLTLIVVLLFNCL